MTPALSRPPLVRLSHQHRNATTLLQPSPSRPPDIRHDADHLCRHSFPTHTPHHDHPQGERDAKTTNTTFYSTEFPKMIRGWREALLTPSLPFVYVELCHELGAEEPKEKDFWQDGQRAALALPFVGFSTTTDIDKSALHPPDKQVALLTE